MSAGSSRSRRASKHVRCWREEGHGGEESGDCKVRLLTFSAGVGLHELVASTGIVKLGGQPCQLRQDLVNNANLGSQIVLVDMEGEEASDIAQPSNNQDRGLLRHREPIDT